MIDKTTTIPKGWKMTTLEEVGVTVTGKTPSKNNPEDWGDFLDFITPTDISSDSKYLKNVARKLSEEGANRFKRMIIPPKSVVVTCIGSDMGKVVMNKNKALTNQQINSIIVNSENDKDYIFYLLRDSYLILRNIAVGGSTMPILNKTTFESLEFLTPSLPEQRAIAAVLSSFDDKIELLREQNKTLEATAQAIFKEWFVNFNFPDADGKTYKTSGGKMIDSELGEIPEGWRVGGLIEDGISEFVKTNIDQFDGTKDYVETSNVDLSNFVGNFEKITFLDRPSRANMQPVKNSFWFARMAESRKYLLFQERDNQDIETKILSTGFAGIQCIKEYLYFYWCFILSDIFNDLKNQYAEGAVQIAISNGGIQRIILVLPPKDLAKKFTETVGFCFEKISNNNSQIKTLSKLRDTLLPKLMKGEVRVKGFED